MPDSLADGRTRVSYVPAISNIASPTTTELNAGLLLNSILTPDGLVGFEPTTADVDTSALDSTYDTVDNGRITFSGTMLRFKKQTGTDTVFTTLVRDVTGYVVIRRDVASATAYSSSQAVEVYPIKCGDRRRLGPEKNSVAKYEVPTKVWQAPNLYAAVA